jgi:O-antigen/teichoic acid export membrane protein
VKGASLAGSALWLGAAKTAAFVLSLAVPLLLVRQLTVREFGVYKQMFLLLDSATLILPLGFAMSAFYFFPRQPADKATVVRNILLVYVLMGSLGGGLVAVSPGLLATLLRSDDLVAQAPLVGTAMLLAVATALLEWVAIANGEARLAAVVIMLSQVARSALLVLAGVFFGSIRALACAAVIHGLLQGAVLAWYIRSRFPSVGGALDRRLMRAQLAYALPLSLAGLLWWVQTSLHHYVVSHRFDAAAYAVYAVGCFQLPVLGIAADAVGSVLIQRVSDLRRRDDWPAIVRLTALALRSLAAIAFPLYALLLVSGREFLATLFTETYRASWPVFAVNLTLVPLSIVATACDAVFRACPEELPFLLRARAVLLVPLLGGLWIATERLGMVGAAIVVVAVAVVERMVVAGKAARTLGLSSRDLGLFGDVAKLAAAAGTAGAVTHLARRALMEGGLREALPLFMLCAGVFAVVHIGMVLLLRVPTPAERDSIRRWLLLLRGVAPPRRAGDMRTT